MGVLIMITQDYISVKGRDVISTLQGLIKQGGLQRVVVKDTQKDRVILDLPIVYIGIGMYMAPLLSGMFLLFALIRQCTIVVYRDSSGENQ